MLFPHFDVFYSGDVAAVSWAGHTFPRWLLLTLATRGCSGAEAVWRWDIKLMDAAAGTVQMVPSSCTVTHRWRHRCNPGVTTLCAGPAPSAAAEDAEDGGRVSAAECRRRSAPRSLPGQHSRGAG